jgi:hypothetical protein
MNNQPNFLKNKTNREWDGRYDQYSDNPQAKLWLDRLIEVYGDNFHGWGSTATPTTLLLLSVNPSTPTLTAFPNALIDITATFNLPVNFVGGLSQSYFPSGAFTVYPVKLSGSGTTWVFTIKLLSTISITAFNCITTAGDTFTFPFTYLPAVVPTISSVVPSTSVLVVGTQYQFTVTLTGSVTIVRAFIREASSSPGNRNGYTPCVVVGQSFPATGTSFIIMTDPISFSGTKSVLGLETSSGNIITINTLTLTTANGITISFVGVVQSGTLATMTFTTQSAITYTSGTIFNSSNSTVVPLTTVSPPVSLVTTVTVSNIPAGNYTSVSLVSGGTTHTAPLFLTAISYIASSISNIAPFVSNVTNSVVVLNLTGTQPLVGGVNARTIASTDENIYFQDIPTTSPMSFGSSTSTTISYLQTTPKSSSSIVYPLYGDSVCSLQNLNLVSGLNLGMSECNRWTTINGLSSIIYNTTGGLNRWNWLWNSLFDNTVIPLRDITLSGALNTFLTCTITLTNIQSFGLCFINVGGTTILRPFLGGTYDSAVSPLSEIWSASSASATLLLFGSSGTTFQMYTRTGAAAFVLTQTIPLVYNFSSPVTLTVGKWNNLLYYGLGTSLLGLSSISGVGNWGGLNIIAQNSTVNGTVNLTYVQTTQ